MEKEEPKVRTIEDFKSFDFKPAFDRVVCYMPPVPTKSKGGIVLPDTVLEQQREQYFKDNRYLSVVAVGDNIHQCSVGDKVLISTANLNTCPVFSTMKFTEDSFILVQGFMVEGKIVAASPNENPAPEVRD